MCIENFTELAFDDVTPEDPDFPAIQGENSKRSFLLETMLLWSSSKWLGLLRLSRSWAYCQQAFKT